MRRIAATVLITGFLLVSLAGPAQARSTSGVGSTNYQTHLSAITPALPGVSIKVIEAGGRLELGNAGAEVVVYGYDHTPGTDDDRYLRVGPGGVFENRKSPATYLNRSRTPTAAETQEASKADPAAPPDWVKVSGGHMARWHDRRIHWMGGTDPPAVRTEPGRTHEVAAWAIDLTRAGTPARLVGTLAWVPGPSPVPWLLLAAVVVVAAVALALTRRWGPRLAAALGVVLVTDLVRSLAIGFAYGGGLAIHLEKTITTSLYSVVGWVLAVLAIRLLVKGSVDGLYAAVFAGLSVALFGGVEDIGMLSHSAAPFALSLGVARTCVAVALGGGLGVVAGSFVVIRRLPEAPLGEPEPEDQPTVAGVRPAVVP